MNRIGSLLLKDQRQERYKMPLSGELTREVSYKRLEEGQFASYGADILGGLGDCATDFFDVTQAYWSYNGGTEKYDCDGGQGVPTFLKENLSGLTGKFFKIRYTVSNYSAGGVYIRKPADTSESPAIGNGTYTYYVLGVEDDFWMAAGVNFIGSIDDIIIQELAMFSVLNREFTGGRLIVGPWDGSGELTRKFTGSRTTTGGLSFSGVVDWAYDIFTEAMAGVIALGAGVLSRVVTFKRQSIGDLDKTGTVTRTLTFSRIVLGILEALGSEEYNNVLINLGSLPYETYTTSGLDITSAINTSGIGVCSYNDALDAGKTYKITFDVVYNSGAYPYYRTASGAGLTTGVVLNEQLAGTGSYTFYSTGTAWHGFRDTSGNSNFEVYNLSVKEGTASLSGALVRQFTGARNIIGGISFSGVVDWSMDLFNRVVTGITAFGAGVLTRVVTFKRPQEGALDTTGTVNRKGTLYRLLTGEVTWSGVVDWTLGLIVRAVTGIATFGAGVLTRIVTFKRPQKGNMSEGGGGGDAVFMDDPDSVFMDDPDAIFLDDGGVPAFSGTVRRKGTLARITLGALTTTGIVSRKGTLYRALAGEVSFSGTVDWSIDIIKRAVAGAMTLGAGVVARVFTGGRQSEGDLNSAGITARKFKPPRAVEGTLDATGTVSRKGTLTRAALGVLTWIGVVESKSTFYRALEGDVTFDGVVEGVSGFFAAVAGALGFGVGTLTRVVTFKRKPEGTQTPTGVLSRKFTGARQVLGNLGFVGTLIEEGIAGVERGLRRFGKSQKTK